MVLFSSKKQQRFKMLPILVLIKYCKTMPSTLVNGKMVNEVDEVNKYKKMALIIKGNGKIICLTERAV